MRFIILFFIIPICGVSQDASIFFFKKDEVAFLNEKSILFSSGTEHIDCGDDGSINTSEYSLSFWFKASSSGFQYLVFRDSSYRVFFNGSVRFECFDNQPSVFTLTSSSGLADNNWHHVVCVFGASDDIYLYVDGILETSRIVGFSNAANIITKDLYLANNYRLNRDFQGNIDEYAFFNKKLVQSDVTRLYNNGIPANLSSESGLIMWLRMGDGDIFPTLTDNIGGNNGTMTNMNSSDIVFDVPN